MLLLRAGPWVRLWDIEMYWILALPPEVQGCNTVGRSDKAGGWEAAEEVGSDNPEWAGLGAGAVLNTGPRLKNTSDRQFPWQSSHSFFSLVCYLLLIIFCLLDCPQTSPVE